MTFKTTSIGSDRKDRTEPEKQSSANGPSTSEKARKVQQRVSSRELPLSMSGMDRADGAVTPLSTPASESCPHDSSRTSKFPLAAPPSHKPSNQFRTLAASIANPQQFYHPALAVTSWCKLKAMRGQPISDQQLDRLGVEVDQVNRKAIEAATRTQRIRYRAREHADRIGHTGPRPLICPDAIA